MNIIINAAVSTNIIIMGVTVSAYNKCVLLHTNTGFCHFTDRILCGYVSILMPLVLRCLLLSEEARPCFSLEIRLGTRNQQNS